MKQIVWKTGWPIKQGFYWVIPNVDFVTEPIEKYIFKKLEPLILEVGNGCAPHVYGRSGSMPLKYASPSQRKTRYTEIQFPTKWFKSESILGSDDKFWTWIRHKKTKSIALCIVSWIDSEYLFGDIIWSYGNVSHGDDINPNEYEFCEIKRPQFST